jgi:tRNA(Ile)-lysidine synthase
MMDLATQVADCFKRHGFEASMGIVAVSGGPDSVALAHVLTTLLQGGKLSRLVLAHLNHQLRRDESEADEAFVKNLPALFDVEHEPRVSVRTQRIDVAALAEAERANLESVARRERYRWLTQVAREEAAVWIATGHSADDQAETVLFRLLRGSGMLGLGAMRECRAVEEVQLIRPLLHVRRRDIHAYLADKQIAYCVDSSNSDRRFTRNRLRNELMPFLEKEFNPGVVDVLCRLARQAQDLHEQVSDGAVQLLLEAELPRADRTLVFALERLRRADDNTVREMFRLVWMREAWPMGTMDFKHWDRLLQFVSGTQRAIDLPGGIHACLRGKVVQLGS